MNGIEVLVSHKAAITPSAVKIRRWDGGGGGGAIGESQGAITEGLG
jgi:hypothetical protein